MRKRSAALVALTVALSGTVHADEEGRTNGLIANGAVATVLGGAALILGGAMYGKAQATWNQSSGCYGSCTDGNVVSQTAGLGLMAAGAAHLGIGIPLLSVGAHRRSQVKTVRVSAAVAPTRTGVAGSFALRW